MDTSFQRDLLVSVNRNARLPGNHMRTECVTMLLVPAPVRAADNKPALTELDRFGSVPEPVGTHAGHCANVAGVSRSAKNFFLAALERDLGRSTQS